MRHMVCIKATLAGLLCLASCNGAENTRTVPDDDGSTNPAEAGGSSDTTDGGSGTTGKLACPPKGLGVEEFEGKTTVEQMADFKAYACEEPQICPDQGGQSGQMPIDPNALPAEASFLLINCSTGSKKLEIEKVVVYGDDRCYFSEVTDADILKKVVNPSEASAIRVTYKPTEPGEDHAELRVFSNAENFPVLKLRVCSTAYIHTDPPPNTPLVCKAKDSLNSQCHQ